MRVWWGRLGSRAEIATKGKRRQIAGDFLNLPWMMVRAGIADAEEPALVLLHVVVEGLSIDGKVGSDDLEHPTQSCCCDVYVAMSASVIVLLVE